jgi:hypothetical protein
MVIDRVLTPLNFVFLVVELLIGVLALVASFPGEDGRAPRARAAAGPEPDADRPDPLRAYRG